MKSFVVTTIVAFVLCFANEQTSGQSNPPVYLDTTVATIRITIDPDSLAAIYDPANADSDHEYPANFTFNNGVINDSLANIGFRLRGNTSRDSRKKSFKVSINSFVRGRKFYGLEKLNLNSEHNDPSIIRAKLSWDLFAASGVKGSRAHHTRLYINTKYYGLYISVEHIDENFVLGRHGNNDGNLFKCLYPADLAYLGADPNLYKRISGGRRIYELTINEEIDDYTDLAHFITVLTQTSPANFPIAIQRVFNVNAFLRSLAVDVVTGSWDDYWFWKNNFYLYHNTATGKFEFIPYDYDNTFGIWWTQIMAGVDWGTRSVYSWGHPTESRPLTTKLLGVQQFRDRFTFYLNRLLQRQFVETKLFARIDSIHAMITSAAEADSFRTLDYNFTIADFHNSYTQALGRHVPYGLKPYITTRRASALNQITPANVAPILSDLVHAPRYPFANDPVTFTLRIEDESVPPVAGIRYRINGGAWQPTVALFDDGLHNDGAAGDEVYGATLSSLPANAFIEYYATATDLQNQTSVEPPDAPTSLAGFRVSGEMPKLCINEFMAKNDTTIRDPYNELEDWIEIYNADTVAIRMKNWYLTDNFSNPKKWRFPDTTIAVGGFLLIWADEDTNQGPLHATFKLDRSGERIGLFRGDSVSVGVVDTISFGYQESDAAFGRMPDGAPAWRVMPRATPGYANRLAAIEGSTTAMPRRFALDAPYPNPFNAAVTIRFQMPQRAHIKLSIYDVLGREVETLINSELPAGMHSRFWNAAQFSSGLYLCRLQSDVATLTAKILLAK
ncbi:MAG: CotH kinase family protein [Ignavibacteriae bacterium]|nr:CotH kinase family protein [Ignavibacteriota bacterium]